MRRILRFVCILCATMIAAPGALRCADVGRSDGDMGPSNMPSFGAPTRIKNIVTIQGVRANQLVGYGLVIGLNGTGDSLRNSPFTDQSIQAMLDRMGVNIRRQNTRTRNSAAVIVTAELPPFVQTGATIDVTVSSLGDATSLLGGTLIMTPLNGPDQLVYGVAQGPVTVSGYQITGAAQTVTQNVPTSGRIPNGALIERESPGIFAAAEVIGLALRNPDFSTAIRVSDAINSYGLDRFGVQIASAGDLRSIAVKRPPSMSATRLMAEIGELIVEPDVPARVVVDERTGTIVIGRDVQIHGCGNARKSDRDGHRDTTGFATVALLGRSDGGDAGNRHLNLRARWGAADCSRYQSARVGPRVEHDGVEAAGDHSRPANDQDFWCASG